jgi:hypothetical protein
MRSWDMNSLRKPTERALHRTCKIYSTANKNEWCRPCIDKITSRRSSERGNPLLRTYLEPVHRTRHDACNAHEHERHRSGIRDTPGANAYLLLPGAPRYVEPRASRMTENCLTRRRRDPPRCHRRARRSLLELVELRLRAGRKSSRQRYSSRIRTLRAKPSRAGNEGYFRRGSILTDFPRTSAVRT